MKNTAPTNPAPERRGAARPRAIDRAGSMLSHGERYLASAALRDARNLRESCRLLVLVLLVAAGMGVAAWAFLSALDAVTGLRERNLAWFALLPAVSLSTAWLYRTRGLRSGRGNNLVIDSAVGGDSIHARMAVLTFFCSIATHLAGGSAGREGTAVQIGGTLASNVSRLFHLADRDHHDLMLSSISAAFGGVFGTPLAGAFFGMEMCYVGKLDYSSALYCLVASFTGDAVSRLLGTGHAVHAIGAVPALDIRSAALTAAAGICFGLVARAFSYAIRMVRSFYAQRFRSYLLAALVGSLVLLGAYALMGAWRYAGLSEWLVEAGFRGETTPIDALAKLIFTALTLGAGYQGGEVTPLFGIGASLGGWLGTAAGVDPSFAAALGMIGVFGAALNVPISTIMLGIDLFGGEAAAYFVITAFVGYLVAGHHGVYPAQRIVTPKRRSLADDALLTVDQAIERQRDQVVQRVGDETRMDGDRLGDGKAGGGL
ncbi:MAG: chloride channel protein [Collinsella sp.]|nr:chloride channel protein [Collinsella sp.]